jgi:hypothetical protein
VSQNTRLALASNTRSVDEDFVNVRMDSTLKMGSARLSWVSSLRRRGFAVLGDLSVADVSVRTTSSTIPTCGPALKVN